MVERFVPAPHCASSVPEPFGTIRRDPETDEWKNSSSFRPGDLPALIFALTKAQEHCYTVPVPGDEEQSQGDDPF